MACRTVSFGPRFRPQSAPVTFWFLIVTLVLNLVLFFAGPSVLPAVKALVFDPSAFPARPWTLLTSPFLNYMEPFWFLLLGYVFWWVGADQERWWGSKIQAGLLAAVAVATGLMLALSSHLFPTAGPATVMVGAGPLLCALFTTWCLRHPDGQIILLIVPVTGRVMLVLEVAMLWFDYGPVHGFFAVLGSAGLAALYFYKGEHFHRFLAGRGQRQEKRRTDRRFARMMKRSGLHLVDDDPPPPPRH